MLYEFARRNQVMDHHGESQNLPTQTHDAGTESLDFMRTHAKPRSKEEESRKLADDGSDLRDFATSRETQNYKRQK
jgi:hypothetical protein